MADIIDRAGHYTARGIANEISEIRKNLFDREGATN
jgi:hypothetical protein